MDSALLILFFNLLAFLSLSFFVFYILGFNIISFVKKELKPYEIVALSNGLGMIIFLLLAILMGILNLRILVLPLICLVALLTFIKYRFTFLSPWSYLLKDKTLLGLTLLGIIVLGSINFASGFKYNGDLLFWSSHGYDGMWHISLMEAIKKGLPPLSPIFANEPLYNYHYFADVVMGEFYRLFPFFSSLDLYFRFFPILFCFNISLAVFSFVSKWQDNKLTGYWAIFATFFIGSFGYLLTFIREGKLFAGETVFWAAQGHSILGNPPHAISYALIPLLFLSIYNFLQTRSKIWFVISFLLGGFLAGFKVSAGFSIAPGLVIAALLDLFTTRSIFLLLLTGSIGIANFFTFRSITHEGSSLLVWEPWWFIRTMVVTSERLNWLDMELRRQTYISEHNFKRVFQLEATAFLIFIVGNLGMRALGSYIFIKSILSKSFYKKPLDVLIFITLITSFVMPLLFVQKGIPFNTIQFMQYFLLIFGFYFAITMTNLSTKLQARPILKSIVIGLVIIFSIPTVVANFTEYYGPTRRPTAMVSRLELEAINYLKQNTLPADVILNRQFDKSFGFQDKFQFSPKPIFAWFSTSYLSALSARVTYMSAEDMLDQTGYPVKERQKEVSTFFEQKNQAQDRDFLKKAKIKYIYLPKQEYSQKLDLTVNNLETFFENGEVVIYKVI